MCVFHGIAVFARVRNPRAKVSGDQLCNLKDKRSGFQEGIENNLEHLWGRQWQDLNSIFVLLTLMSFASLCASTLLPLGHRQRSTVKGIYLRPLSEKQADKTTTSKQREEETIGCQLLINKFSLDCF